MFKKWTAFLKYFSSEKYVWTPILVSRKSPESLFMAHFSKALQLQAFIPTMHRFRGTRMHFLCPPLWLQRDDSRLTTGSGVALCCCSWSSAKDFGEPSVFCLREERRRDAVRSQSIQDLICKNITPFLLNCETEFPVKSVKNDGLSLQMDSILIVRLALVILLFK